MQACTDFACQGRTFHVKSDSVRQEFKIHHYRAVFFNHECIVMPAVCCEKVSTLQWLKIMFQCEVTGL